MGKKEKRRSKIEEVDEEGEQRTLLQSVGSDDDAEANEDLSLKIVEKALSMRAAKLKSGVDGGFTVTHNTGVAAVMELDTSSSPLEAATETASAGPSGIKNKRKKKAAKKMETSYQSMSLATIVIEQNKAEAGMKSEEAVEDFIKGSEPRDIVEEPVNAVLRKLLRGPRYFDPPDSGGWPACYNCGEQGHMAVNCTSFTKKQKSCFVCGSLGHGAKQCRKARECFICKSGGHRAKYCPDKYNGILHSSKLCLKCGGSGHDMFLCKNDYSASDLKVIQCYICRSFGHLCCANHIDDSRREVSCYKCGKLGHTGLACLRLCKEAASVASPSLCYNCGEGHFARECSSSVKSRKRNHESSTPTLRAHKGSNEASGVKSAPQALGKTRKRRKTKSEESEITTPRKLKRISGWLTEDPGDGSQIQPPKSKHRGWWIKEGPRHSSQIKPRKSKHRGESKAEDSQGLSQSTPHRSKSTDE